MEYIYGKRTAYIDAVEFAARLASYHEVWLDLGTGDGHYVEYLAGLNPSNFVIGLDACRENLVRVSRRTPPNALYLIANGESLPTSLEGRVTGLTINFPWGSLLTGLLEPASKIHQSLQRVAQPGATLQVRLNGQALLKAGYEPGQGAIRIAQALERSGFEVTHIQKLDATSLRACPSSWAKRLAAGRDPQAFYLEAVALKKFEAQDFDCSFIPSRLK